MAIQTSEFLFYKALENSSTGTNGGRPDESATSPSDQLNNTWPNVLSDERVTGSNLKRKKFCKIANTADLSLLNTKVFLHKPTSADDRVVWFPGTMRNTQGDLTGLEKKYGVATLATSVSSGNTIVVTLEDADDTGLFQDGNVIVLHNKANQTDVAGVRKFFTITGTPVQVSTQVTITTVEAVADSFTADAAWVATVHEAGTIQTSYDNLVVTSASGTFDNTSFPPILTNLGTIEQTWTVEFITATTYSMTGDTVGLLATTGDVASNYSPLNPGNGYAYLTLESGAFGGTYQAGDTIVLQTHPIMYPFWQDRDVPAGASSFSANEAVMVFIGESSG